MAADPLTRTFADAALKEFYLPGIRSILNSEVFLLSQLETNSEDIEGRRAVLSVNTGRNAGIGARAENTNLPDAGHQAYAEERVPLKYNYGRIQLTGPVIRSMGSDRGSFTRAITSETQGVTRDLRNDVNRQLFGDGTGAIAALATAASSTTFTLLTPTSAQKRQVTIGMKIDVGLLATPSSGGSATIIAFNPVTGVGTTDVAVTAAAGSWIFRAGSGGVVGTSQKEVTGLAAQIANSGTLWNINPSTAPDWASYVDSNSGTTRPVTETMFIRAAQEINVRCGEELNLWVTSAGVQRAYAATLLNLRRFNEPTTLRGGYKGLDMSNFNQGNTGTNTVSMYWDKDCPDSTAYGITTRRFQWYKMSDWEFMEEDGAVLSRVANQDAYEATLFLYSELATDGRNAHAKIVDMTEV